MPYAEVTNFSRGLDSRSHHLTAEPGSLETLTNGHITRGGDIEKRKAFTVHKTLPAGTFGMETTLSDGLVVFGSAVDPGVPSGVTYQRLQHPGGSSMTELVYSTVFSGKTFALAKFADGLTLGFYDGTLIDDFHLGVVRSDHSALSDVASELATEIDSTTEYSAGAGGAVISITGAVGENFTPSKTVTNASGGTDDQEISFTTAVEPISAITETTATASVQISGTGGVVTQIDAGSVVIYSGFQKETVTCVADVSDSLDGTHFQISDENGTVAVWIDVDNSGTAEPSHGLDRAIEVTGVITNDSATAVGVAVASAINADSKFSASSASGVVTVIHATAGAVGDGVDVDTGFSFAIIDKGAGDWVASDENTAAAIATAINNFTPASSTVADVTVTSGGFMYAKPTITFSAPTGGGTTATGYAVTSTSTQWTIIGGGGAFRTVHTLTDIIITNAGSGYTSTPTITYGYTAYTGGSDSPHTSDPTATVLLKSSSEPSQFSATSSGTNVVISGLAGTGTSVNGVALTTYVTGAVTATALGTFSGGVDAVAGRAKVVEATLSGTLDVGDVYSITLTDSSLRARVFGGTRVASISAIAARTLKQKVYMAADSLLYFSETAVPTSWQDDSFGSGVINITENFGGSAPLTGIGTYQNQLAVFSRRSTQIWYVDPDDALNQQIQTIDNIGALSPLSVVSLGDSDVFFVSDSGIRSLRVRDSSGNAAVTDVGTPIDTLVIDDLSNLTEAQKKAIPAVYEPIDGRYWVVINGKIYVYSWFPGSRVAAWSQYTPEYDVSGTLTTMGTISKMVTLNDRIYLRAGNNIFIYGGTDNATYDASVCTAVVPYLSMGEAATDKKITALDFAVDGTWAASTNTNPSAPAAWQSAGTADESTFATQAFRAAGLTTHTKVKLATTGSEAARVSSVIVHYRKEKSG